MPHGKARDGSVLHLETGGAIELKELPFVVGVLGDFTGQPTEPLPKLKERKFVEVNPDNFDSVLEGMKPTLLGVGVGTVGALALGRALSSLIYEVKPTDPLTFLVVTALLAAIALLATIIPAYRAAKVDPMVALRYE